MRLFLSFLFYVMLTFLISPLMANERAEISVSGIPYLDESYQLQVELEVQNYSGFPIQSVHVHYKKFGDLRFLRQRVHREGLRYLASVDLSEYEGEMVEYFFDIEYADGTHQAYPLDAADGNLMQIGSGQGLESANGILIISPEPNEKIFTDEFLLTVSFFQYSDQVDKERTKLYLNTWDVSRYVSMFDEFLTFAPRRVPPGRHALRLELYDQTGQLLARKVWNFTSHQRKVPSVSVPDLSLSGNFFAMTRNENLLDGASTRSYSRTGLSLNARSKTFEAGTRIYLSDQENGSKLQPINRYTGWTQLNFWDGRYVRLAGGDVYPRLNPFLLQNVFVRGVHGQAFLKFLNVDLTTGMTRRGIEGQVVPADPLVQGDLPDTLSGAFKRRVQAVRTSLGARQNFQFGLALVHGRDDPQSVQFGFRPQESIGLGSDLFIALDNNRFAIEGSYNLSFYNPDIGNGEDLTLEAVQESGLDISSELYDIATRFLTVNEYLIVLPGIAYEGRVRLNYFNNNLSVSYKYVQDEFRSLGQPFLHRDVQGLSIADNIRLFKNQVFLNLRYQTYQNNLTDNKNSTTDNQTLAVNLSYFPQRNLPSFTFGYSNQQRANDTPANNTNPLLFQEDNQTNTLNFSTSYGFQWSSLRNRLTLNLLTYNREDATGLSFAFDNLSNTLALILQTRYSIPLKTRLEFTVQQTDNTSSASDNSLSLNSFGGGVEYRFPSLMSQGDNLTLSVNSRLGRVSYTQTPDLTFTSSEYNRAFLNGRIIYSHRQLGRISINADQISYTGDRNSKDVLFTARYDVRF